MEWVRPQMEMFGWGDRMQLSSFFEVIESLDRQVDVFTSKIASIAEEDRA